MSGGRQCGSGLLLGGPQRHCLSGLSLPQLSSLTGSSNWARLLLVYVYVCEIRVSIPVIATCGIMLVV